MKKSAFITMLILVTVMLTGCFFDFGPVSARVPEYRVANTDGRITLSEPLVLQMTSYTSGQRYSAAVENNKVANVVLENGMLYVYPEGKWTSGANKVQVTAYGEDDTTKNGSPVTFTVEASNKLGIRAEISKDMDYFVLEKIILTPYLDNVPENGKVILEYTVSGKAKESINIDNKNKTITIDAAGMKTPEMLYELRVLDKDGKYQNDVSVPETLHIFKAPVTLNYPRSNDNKFTFNCEGSWKDMGVKYHLVEVKEKNGSPVEVKIGFGVPDNWGSTDITATLEKKLDNRVVRAYASFNSVFDNIELTKEKICGTSADVEFYY